MASSRGHAGYHEPPPPPLEHALHGRYRLERVLGEGGMGVVWLAEDLRHGRPVALKVLRPELSGQLGPRRFLREIELVARLTHPHILPLYDSGEADGLLFYTSPFVSCQSLRQRLVVEKRLPLAEALRITREVADAVDYAHRSNVLHRDLKPENILIEEGHAVVADFGLARAIGRAAGSPKTSSGVLLGTPAYMSPEQAAGRADLDGRSDLYGLGCVLYEILAGTPPFSGDTVEQVLFQHLSAEAPDIGEQCPELPEHVRACLRQCLAKDRQARFATGAEMMRALEASAREAEPARARPTWPGGGRSDAQRQSFRTLPEFGTRFVGRVEEMNEAARRLRTARLVTLVGVGGVGKTRLAVELGRDLLHEYPDGVWFVDLAPLSDDARVPQTMAAALGVTPVSGASLEESLAAFLQTREALLVLDNCEHVRAACAEIVTSLLRVCPGITFLATSRQALGVIGESSYVVTPLAGLTGQLGPEQLMRSEAVELFVDRARLANPAFRVTAENAAAIADVCQRVEGVPLALELIAGRLEILSIEEVRVRLGGLLRLGSTSDRRFPRRHRLLAATLEWSYGLLDEDERELFMALSVFSAGWTLEAATAVCGAKWDEIEVLDRLTALAAKSLVARDREVAGRSRHRYLEIVRQFARERLAESPREPQVRAALLEYLASLAERGEAGLWGAEAERWLKLLEADHETFLASIGWASEDPALVENGLRVAGSLYRFWYTRGYFAAARQALSRILAAPGADAHLEARMAALYGAAGMALYGGDYAAARRMYEEGVARCRERGDQRSVARWLVGLGLAIVNLGDLDLAERCYAEGLEIYRQMDEPRGVAVTLLNLAQVAQRRGEIDLARDRATEALVQARRNENRVMGTTILAMLATLAVESGRWGEARSVLAECLHGVRDLDLKKTGLEALEVMADLVAARGEGRRAVELLGAVDGMRQSWGVIREPGERDSSQSKLQRLRVAVGDDSFRESWSAGRALGFAPALERALGWLEAQPSA